MGCMREYEGGAVCPYCGYTEGTSAARPFHLTAGAVLNGRYTVGRTLGFGGFGATYIGWDGKLGRTVAIKEYLPAEYVIRQAGDARITVFDREKSEAYRKGLEKFLGEARMLAKLDHIEGIVRIYDSFEENNTAYIVMEYLEGERLDQYLSRVGRIEPGQAITMLLPVMAALGAVHSLGIVHRDVAPNNIHMMPSGTLKIYDFGSARHETVDRDAALTVMVKYGYSPEEQYRREGRQGSFTDVYALAVTLYTMITGEIPPNAIERATSKEDSLIPPRRLCGGLTVNQETAILNALNIWAENRTQTMEEFREELTSGKTVRRRPDPRPQGREQNGLQRTAAGNGPAEGRTVRLAPVSSRKGLPTWVKVCIPTALAVLFIALCAMLFGPSAGNSTGTGEQTGSTTATATASVQIMTTGTTAAEEDNEVTIDGVTYDLSTGTVTHFDDVNDAVVWTLVGEYCITGIRDGACKGNTSLQSVTIHNGITNIGNNAFEGCTNLKTVRLPESVKYIGNACFDGCSRLEVSYAGAAEEWRSIDVGMSGNADLNKAKKLYNCEYSPYDTDDDTTVTIDGVTYDLSRGEVIHIEEQAEAVIWTVIGDHNITAIRTGACNDNDAISSVTIQNGITKMEKDAFAGCKNLHTVTIPKSLICIEDNFGGCDGISVFYEGTRTDWNRVFPDGISLKDERVHFNATISCGTEQTNEVTIDGVTYDLSAGTVLRIDEVRDVTIWTVIGETPITAIKDSACANNQVVENVTIKNGISVIEANAFLGCKNLKTITVPQSVTAIGSPCFYNTPRLQTVFYTGSEEQFHDIDIRKNGNTWFVWAMIQYGVDQ